MKFSNKENGIRGKEIPDGVYAGTEAVEAVLGVRKTGLNLILVDNGTTLLNFHAQDGNLKFDEPVVARVLKGTPVMYIKPKNGWMGISTTLYKGQKIFINGNSFEQPK